MAFNDRVKQARKKVGLTQEQLGAAIGVAKSTIAGYEKGTSHPDVSKIQALINELGVDANFLWQDTLRPTLSMGEFAPSADEQNHIKNYRDLDDHGKKVVSLVLEEEHARCKREASNLVYLDPNKSDLRVWTQSAAAGTGNYLDSDGYDIVRVPSEKLSRHVAHGVWISGDSMEPDYPNGGIALVATRLPEAGEVGVFILNSELYVKERGEEGLVSLNPKYGVIRIGEFDSFGAVGTVVGVIRPEDIG